MTRTLTSRKEITAAALRTLTIDQLRVLSKKGFGREKIIARRLLREIEPQPADKKKDRIDRGMIRNYFSSMNKVERKNLLLEIVRKERA